MGRIFGGGIRYKGENPEDARGASRSARSRLGASPGGGRRRLPREGESEGASVPCPEKKNGKKVLTFQGKRAGQNNRFPVGRSVGRSLTQAGGLVPAARHMMQPVGGCLLKASRNYFRS